MGNSSYCATLSPTWFLNPASTALVVKLTDFHYGITVKVVQTFDGTTLPDDTLMVWGDNGGLCRIFLNGYAVGDSIVLGLNESDLMGNSIWNPEFPPDLEAAGDYMVSVCGVHALEYANGMISGPITEQSIQHMPVSEFEQAIMSCSLGTGIKEEAAEQLVVRYAAGVPQLELPGCSGQVQMNVLDAQGRAVIARNWDGTPLALQGLASGAYVADVRNNGSRWVRKVVVH
jgi:hypothetical protein